MCLYLSMFFILLLLFFIHIFFSTAASATALRDIFYLQAFFTLCSFTNILTCVYQGFPGSRQFFLEVCRASYWSSKHRPGPSVCLIHSNPQTSYSERFNFKFYNVLAWITCDESLIYLLITRFELFACLKSYVKAIKKHFKQDLLPLQWISKLFLSIIENNRWLTDMRCFWGLNIFSIQNRLTICRFVPPCR